MAVPSSNLKWREFRKSKLGLAFGIVLAFMLSYLLMLYGGLLICLPTILVAVILYFVPRYFGLVSRKKLVVVALVMMVLLGLATGYTVFLVVKDIQPEPVSADIILSQGTVTPFRGSGSDIYNFTVTVTSENVSASSEVWVNLFDYFNTNYLKRINLTHSFNGTSEGSMIFYERVELSSSIYRHTFNYNQSADKVVTTRIGWGPTMLSESELLLLELYYNTLYVVVNVGLWFALVLMATWWMESSKKKVEAVQKQKKETEAKVSQEKFVCSECGADVPIDAKECPQCGEKFEDEARGPEKCPSCGKETAPGATNCWNCGKEIKK